MKTCLQILLTQSGYQIYFVDLMETLRFVPWRLFFFLSNNKSRGNLYTDGEKPKRSTEGIHGKYCAPMDSTISWTWTNRTTGQTAKHSVTYDFKFDCQAVLNERGAIPDTEFAVPFVIHVLKLEDKYSVNITLLYLQYTVRMVYVIVYSKTSNYLTNVFIY